MSGGAMDCMRGAGLGCVLVRLRLGGLPEDCPKTYLGDGRQEGGNPMLRPCLGCFLSYKERTEVDKSLYLVKNNSCSQPDLIWCGASRSLDAHFFFSDTLDSFSDPYFVTLCHVRHSALIHALPLFGTVINSSPDQLIAIGFPFTSSHILPLRGGVAQR